jgi:hypothetical protein
VQLLYCKIIKFIANIKTSMLSQFLSKKLFFTTCSLLLICTLAKAQSTYPHYFAIPDYARQPNSFYNKISLVDLRIDTLSMGFIQTGAFNKRNIIVPKTPMWRQVDFNLASQIDGSAGTNELVLQLRELNFSEVTGAVSESGFFKMRAKLFAKTDKGYQQINSIDTIAKVSAIDVSNGLLKKAGYIFAGFIASKLTTPISQGSTVTYTDIARADSIEKSQIKVFTTDAFVDGYYATYNSFKNQIPDGEIIVEGDVIKSNSVKAYDEDKKLKTIRPANVYAIINKGQIYMGTTAGYLPVKKVGNDLVFKTQVSGAASPVYTAIGAQYGAIGGAIGGLASALSSTKTVNYQTKIDHLSGNFVTFAPIVKGE